MTRKNLLLYIAKCVSGTAIVLLLAHGFHYADYTWCLISILLVLSPDSSEAIPLAMNRIKANLAGGVASVLCLYIRLPLELAMGAAVALTIVLCYWTKTMAGSRSALAAVIIIMVRQGAEGVGHLVMDRVVSVVVGCLLGLLLTFAFHRKYSVAKDESSGDSGGE